MIERARLAIAGVGLSVLLLPFAGGQGKGKPAKVQEIAAFQTGALPKPFCVSLIRAFDISPDGNTLAVLLETHPRFDNSGASIWLVFWDVDARLIQRSKRLEGPDPETRNHAQYKFKVRFAPKIGRILVLTGSRLLSLDLSSLEIAFAFEARAMAGKALESRLIKHFSISEDGSRLAVEYWQGYPHNDVEVLITQAHDGQILSKRTLPVPGWVALSPDGSRVVVTQDSYGPKGFLSDRPNIFVYDAASGKTEKELTTGQPTVETQFGAKDQVIIHSVDSVRIWDLSLGRVAGLDYGEYGVYGPIGSMAVSENRGLLAVVVHWSSSWNARLDTTIFPSWTRLVLWNLQSGKRIWVSRNGPTGPAVTKWQQVRVSVDGARLALGSENSFGTRIWVFCVER